MQTIEAERGILCLGWEGYNVTIYSYDWMAIIVIIVALLLSVTQELSGTRTCRQLMDSDAIYDV